MTVPLRYSKPRGLRVEAQGDEALRPTLALLLVVVVVVASLPAVSSQLQQQHHPQQVSCGRVVVLLRMLWVEGAADLALSLQQLQAGVALVHSAHVPRALPL